MLKVGWYLILLLFVLILFAGVFKFYKNGKMEIETLLPQLTGIFVFIFICAILYLICRSNVVRNWDELRLWGAYPKALHFYGSLQLGNDADLFANMQPYPPGMPLFLYFLTSFSFHFSDWQLFWGYAVFGASLFYPVILRIGGKLRNFWLYAPCIAVIVLFPKLFYSFGDDGETYFISLFVDAALGLLAGYSFYRATKISMKNNYDLISFSITVAFLTILKDTGILFAISAIVIAVISNLIANKYSKNIQPEKNRWNMVVRTIIPLLCCAMVWIIWKFSLLYYGVTTNASIFLKPVDLITRFNLFTDNIQKLTTYIMLNFSDEQMGYAFALSFFAIDFFLLIISFLHVRKKTCNVLILTYSTVLVLLSQLVFIFGYTYVFASTWLSLHRYMGTLMLNYSLFVFLFCLDQSKRSGVNKFDVYKLDSGFKIIPKSKKGSGSNIVKAAITISLSLILLVASIYIRSAYHPYDDIQSSLANKAIVMADKIADKIANDDNRPDKEKVNIYLMYNQDNGVDLMHHLLYYDLIGSGARIYNFLGEKMTDVDANDKTVIAKSKELKRIFKDGCYDYVFIYSVEPLLSDQYGDVFNVSSPIMSDSLYKINKEDGSLNLILGDLELVYSSSKIGFSDNEIMAYDDIASVLNLYGENDYVISFDIRSDIPGEVTVNDGYVSTSRYSCDPIKIYSDTEYTRVSIYISPFLNDENALDYWLTFSGIIGNGVKPMVKNVEIWLESE